MESLLGKVLCNRYRVDSLLGRGGMAEVYKAWDIERATFLAFKLLREDLAQDPVFLRRFRREAQTLSRLQHPNIVRFYGLEQDDLLAFILMDYIDGTTLQAEIVRAHGHGLSLARVLELMRPVCSALQFAHRKEVVHCDVKPGNILIEKTGRVLVTDFGIARFSEAATATTMAGAGTPAYMSPEQVRGENPTPQIDIYALGIILYEMLTGGERPFTGEKAHITGSTTDKVRWEHLNLVPPSPRRYNPNIPPALETVILNCLEKDPGKRYGSALELFQALERSLSEGGQPTVVEQLHPEPLVQQVVPPAPPEGDQVKAPEILQPEKVTPGIPPIQRRQRWALSGAWVAGLIGVAILLVLSLSGVVWLGGLLSNSGVHPTSESPSTVTETIKTVVDTPTSLLAEITLVPSDTPRPTETHIPSSTPTPSAGMLSALSISASGYDRTGSQDAKGNPVSFEPANAIDGVLNTSWRIKDDGRGEWLQIDFGRTVIINELGIVPGYAKVDPYDHTDRFVQNYVVRTVRLEFSDGSQMEHSFTYDREMQYIPIKNIATTFIRIVILDTYEPRSSNPRYFTPISEIEIRGW